MTRRLSRVEFKICLLDSRLCVSHAKTRALLEAHARSTEHRRDNRPPRLALALANALTALGKNHSEPLALNPLRWSAPLNESEETPSPVAGAHSAA
jgi:hypothetical protein